MGQSLFIELWQGLNKSMGDNNNANDATEAKRFINYTLRDLSNRYDWEFLRGTKALTASAGSGIYDLNAIAQISATDQSIYVQSSVGSADAGAIVSVFGKQIAASSELNISSDAITIADGVTASGSIQYSHIDSFRKAASTGDITVTTALSGGDTIAIMSASETYIANDIRKINFINDDSNVKRVHPYDVNTYEKGNPNGSNLGNFSGYDLTHESKLNLFNVDAGVALSIFYQRTPRYLINDQDRGEFPEEFAPKIIDACYQGYGLRFRDQADAQIGMQRYESLLDAMVADWKIGKDAPQGRIIPAWFKRRL